MARLISDPALRAHIGGAARDAVRTRYIHSAVMPILGDAWEAVSSNK
jgi:hypothetical protein